MYVLEMEKLFFLVQDGKKIRKNEPNDFLISLMYVKNKNGGENYGRKF